jgi:bifunctional non-homologous end joining protein LigD
VVLPIRATLSWDEAKAFTRSVSELMVRTFPDRFVATITKAKRKGKILIDFFRNAEGATAVAPYAVRSRANAPVAMPIHWSELDRDVREDHFNVRNARERLASLADDPWRDFFTVRQSITAAIRKRFA